MMLKFVTLLVIGFLQIFHVHNHLAKADTVFSRAQAIDPRTDIDERAITTQSFLPSLLTEQSTEESVAATETTVNVDTTDRPRPPIFQCDFTTPCFAENQLDRTDGSEFNLVPLSDISPPPVAPTSDVSSITNPTNNSLPCELPYQPQLENGINFTDWNMWFCYNNECPTQNGTQGTCESGLYGLISLNSSESSKTIIDSINSTDSNTIREDFSAVQCLRFNYYFTVYDGEDWGQAIQVWIGPNNEIDNQYSIENFTVADMNENKWQNGEVTFTSTSSNYTLAFSFLVTKENRTDDSESNKTIYFALDNIELYDFNCSDPNKQDTTTTTTTKQPSVTEGPRPSKSKVGLILGLIFGLGLPSILLIIGFVYWKRKHQDHSGEYDMSYTPNDGNEISHVSRD
ncbi:unnamed protein product [Rotaria magnacalcarata]|uniref:MAM domain-containing protein n=2 Tax=Rotaria magnacalcarata TaxID=392030 RepID=A0A819NEE8_9BILA|nr:unnamed protein product [Rotaria magnacalcarata]CAF2089799.1 unnamed protein product [Rotaria magnacalcarata]CAF3880606.1 unnamed protein product [Rotaria magnacalcarata]CAF3992292.1 unnamed protein product [Rotaria magnacalcarata]